MPEPFPVNVESAIADSLAMIEGLNAKPIRRPLRVSDPAKCVGVHSVNWVPQGQIEIGSQEPTVQRYTLRVQSLIKAAKEEEGRALYVALAKTVRVMLYRDPALRLRLSTLVEDSLGSRERFQKCGIQTQRYLNTEFRGAFVFLASTDFWVETETLVTGG